MTSQIKLSSVGIAALLGATMLTTPALASTGYFPHAFGLKSKGVAGSDVAFAQSAMTIAVNPAGLTDVDDQVTVGVSLFSPNRKYKAPAGVATTAQTSKKTLFAIPNFGYSRKLNDKVTIGFAQYAAGGMNSTYTKPVFNAVGDGSGIDMMQIGLSPAMAYKINHMVSFGVAPIFSILRLKAKGLQNFDNNVQSSSSGNVTNEGYDWAFGLGGRVGFQVKPTDRVSFGAYYQSRVYMSKLRKYRGMLAEKGAFDTPASFGVGLAFKPVQPVTLTGAYKRIWYSKVKSIGNKIVGPPAALGTDNGTGFGWRDVDVFSVGAAVKLNDRFTVRAGYSFNTQPIRKSQTMFNILAPAVIQHHITGGATIKLADNLELDLAGMVAPQSSVRGTGATQAAYGATSPITLKMWQVEASAGITWKF